MTVDEKFKKLKDGSTDRYVYYGCTKFKDKYCKCGYVREELLIEQLEKVFDKVSLDEIGMKERIKEELEKHAEFQHQILGKTTKEKYKVKDVDIRNYAKYILRERSIWEKRELLSHLRSKLVLSEKTVSLAKQ